MNIKKIVTQITKTEGLKSSVSIGNVREIISILSDMAFADTAVMVALLNNGKRRAKIKAKKK